MQEPPSVAAAAEAVALRPYPYPYRALLAISTDLDETPDRHVYAETMRFLNTTETTAMGPGAGLEVSNSIYFDMPADQFSYWNTDDAGRAMVQALMHSGHIDCLHSYGDLAATRSHAGKALDELARHDCRVPVWVDHAVAPTNFGAGIMAGHGDEPGHEAYHADLTMGQGVRFIWRGRVTSVLGQEVSPSLRGLWTCRHPVASARTVAKEAAKRLLARRGDPKYAIHRPNRVLTAVTLRDGRDAWEFLRSNPHWGGVSSCETARGIGDVLTDAMLDRLTRRAGACILYTHLGKIDDPAKPFGDDAVAGFRRLAERAGRGDLLVTTVARALTYLHTRQTLRWDARQAGDRLEIAIRTSDGRPAGAPTDLAGVTFTVPDDVECVVTVDGEPSPMHENPPDNEGRRSVSLPWRRLALPEL